jgi:REP element-mobilizing transposase RayT
MNARKQILKPNSFCHAFFRCHNQQKLFEPTEVKVFLLKLWAKYREKYFIDILEFIIMDNHAHMILKIKDVENLGNFMRTANSQLARFINSHFGRDSQAIRDRFKSPMITTESYLYSSMQYVWLNRYKVGGVRPEYDRFCSASWRINPKISSSFGITDKEKKMFSTLLSPSSVLPIKLDRPIIRFVLDLINDGISKIKNLCDKIFKHNHTIGDPNVIDIRRKEISSANKHNRLKKRAPPLIETII